MAAFIALGPPDKATMATAAKPISSKVTNILKRSADKNSEFKDDHNSNHNGQNHFAL